MDTTDIQPENSQRNPAAHLAPWQFKKGVSGNPLGRTPGPSLKEYAKKYLASLTEDERMEFFEGMNKKDIWLMAEGNPQSNDAIKHEVTFPTPIAPIQRNDLSGNIGISENSTTQ